MSSQESVLAEINDPVMNVIIPGQEHLNAINFVTCQFLFIRT